MTYCLYRHSHREKCVIPDNVTLWTIHGLWPKTGAFCNASWPFNETKIKELVPFLKLYWPDLQGTGSEFWKYEWDKHGTCAASLPELNSEFKYFNKALELHHDQNILKMLSTVGIVPSLKHTYKFADIEMAFHKVFGVTLKIQCIQEKDHKQMLGQIEVCLNKSLLPIDCEHNSTQGKSQFSNSNRTQKLTSLTSFHVCSNSLPVVYPPISTKMP
uniref:ribonuclease T2 n=1 Tax=Myxine glutinosa TaxID=7769 RepID=UPI00358F3075